MLKIKKEALVKLSIVLIVWTISGFASIGYGLYLYFQGTDKQSFLHHYIIVNFLLLAVVLIGIRRILLHFAKIIEKKDDRFVVYTLLKKYEFRKEDVFINKCGQVVIDLYSCKLTINKNDYVDLSKNKSFWKEFINIH